jgi:biotin carboxyl carrier protein
MEHRSRFRIVEKPAERRMVFGCDDDDRCGRSTDCRQTALRAQSFEVEADDANARMVEQGGKVPYIGLLLVKDQRRHVESFAGCLPSAPSGIPYSHAKSGKLMSFQIKSIAERVRQLAEFLDRSDAVLVRIERPDDTIEVARYGVSAPASVAPASLDGTAAHEAPLRVESIKADLVGIFRLSRPLPFEGEHLDDDRELAYIEALGMRNPVRSLGPGRIVTIAASDGAPVEYGQALFLLDRD